MPKSSENGYYRPKQAAAYLGIGISTFWRWTQNGTLPKGIRLSSRCTVWAKDALDAFICRQAGGQA